MLQHCVSLWKYLVLPRPCTSDLIRNKNSYLKKELKYSWPLNNICLGPLMQGCFSFLFFFWIWSSTINIHASNLIKVWVYFLLLMIFLMFSLAYSTIRIQFIIHITYKLHVCMYVRVLMLLVRLWSTAGY